MSHQMKNDKDDFTKENTATIYNNSTDINMNDTHTLKSENSVPPSNKK